MPGSTAPGNPNGAPVPGARESQTSTVTPTGTQPSTAAASIANPSPPSPLTQTSAQVSSGTSGSAAQTTTPPHTAASSSPAASHTDATRSTGLHSALLDVQASGREDSAGDSFTRGEHRGGPHTAAADIGSTPGAGGAVHDNLWVPDSTLQTPAEAASVGATSAPVEGLAVAYDAALTDPALAPGAAALVDLGALDLGGGLAQAVETLHATIALAARQGVSQARIALHPAELGAIRIHLTQTAEGLYARVTADTPAAAQALATGHAELRHSLGQLGLGSVRLHIAHGSGAAVQGEGGAAAESRQGGRRAGARAGEVPTPAGAIRTGALAAADVLDDAETQIEPPTLTQSGRTLDVLV